MAVELRCPDCRAKLRLKTAPEAGTEVECPKCGTVFPAPDPDVDADAAPKKKKKSADDEERAAKEEAVKELKKAKGKGDNTEKPNKKAAKGKKQDPNVPRKRKAKKRETSKVALIGVICAGVFMVIFMTSVLIWFFTRTSKAVEMLYYAPEDAQMALGMNLEHVQRYPEFYKSLKSMQDGTDFRTAADAIAKAAGTDTESLVTHIVKAESAKNGWAIIYRTKEEYDSSTLAKIPGATKKSLDGFTYYVVPGLLPSNQTGVVFSPTNRLIVVCPGSTESKSEFRRMLAGHPDSRQNTLGVRMGALGKRVTRGTFWQMVVFDNELKTFVPTGGSAPAGGGGNGEDDNRKKFVQTVSDGLNGAKGFGIKASLGSREVRFEVVVWYNDSDKPSAFATKMKESELGKGDEGTPPKWFKDITTSLGDRKVQAQLLSNISFSSSGELFFVRSSVETVDLQQTSSTAMSKVLGIAPNNQGGMGGPMPGAGPGGPMPGGGPPPGGPPPGGPPPGGPMPPMPRRRFVRRVSLPTRGSQ